MYNKFLSYLIKEIRENFEMTQKEFGATIEKSEISIRKYESGEVKIPFTTLFVILKMLDIDIIFLKGLVDDVKHLLIKNNVLSERELNKCLEQFNIDISKIYKLNIDSIDINNYKSIEEMKVIFDNQMQEYIKNYASYVTHESVKYYLLITINKNATAKIREEVTNFLNYKIEKFIGALFSSDEEMNFLEKNNKKQYEEIKKIKENFYQEVKSKLGKK
jgi:putative DNA-binding protein|nr:MAG TPA: Helix-turn-helix XRE-family like protein [Caudoviricetes sp.]